ncbi:MAG: hypothetical protein EOP49_50775, partial [Sphingobacteriales bacterium]
RCRAAGKAVDERRLSLEKLRLGKDGKELSFEMDGKIWLIDLATYACRDTGIVSADQSANRWRRAPAGNNRRSRWQGYATSNESPDKTWTAFISNGNVFIKPVNGGDSIRFTSDGTTDKPYGSLAWSPDSKWLAYTKSASNNFRNVMLWSLDAKKATALSDPMADAIAPVWDLNGRYLYFLASTNVALGSGWANTSSQQARPTFGVYITVLRKDDPNPFPLKTDEEPDTTGRPKTKDTTTYKGVKIDWEHIDRRIIAMPVPVGSYNGMLTGPKGSVLIVSGPAISLYTVAAKKLEELVKGGSQFAVSANGEKLLFRSGPTWRVVSTGKPAGPTEGIVSINLRMELNRVEEWKQIFT